MIHVLLALLLSAAPIDLDMTPQDKKKTGVYKLSDEEKSALQSWINDKQIAQTKRASKKNPSIAENLNNGSYIKLTDNSIWNIRPQDTAISQSWITEVEITTSPSGDPQYPTKLTNTLSGSSVLARRVTEVPNARAPQSPATPEPKTPAKPG